MFALDGMAELVEVLKKFPGNQATNILRTGILRGAELVAEKAKELAPVDTGDLKKSIKARRASGRGREIIRSLVEARVWYANLVEKGHLTKSAEGAAVHVPAKPFMVPAVEITADQVLAAIEKGIKDEINFKISHGFKARRLKSGVIKK